MRKVPLRRIFHTESISGVVLITAALLAVIMANSPYAELYHYLIHTEIQFRIAHLDLEKSLLHWVNDGLMAIFFLVIGLHLKRALIEGALASRQKAMFPVIAAFGGMLAPALIYLIINSTNPAGIQGWAIPAATDIAFAVGVLALLGDKIPINLKIFLLALAIMDDLGAIMIIALFYTTDLSWLLLLIATSMAILLWLMQRYNVTAITPYLIIGWILWLVLLESGVHATLSGVIVGFMVPLHNRNTETDIQTAVPAVRYPSKALSDWLDPWVNFIILPLFAFTNAGIVLHDVAFTDITSALPMGVALGLLLGKPLGIYSICVLALKCHIAVLPDKVNLRQIFAVSVLCGIGFTMSMFITALAFDDEGLANLARLGVLMGSSLAAVGGYVLLNRAVTVQEKIEEKRVG